MAKPTKDEWDQKVAAYWFSDGSSKSTDTIFGSKIGRTGTEYSIFDTAAGAHDWRYEKLRDLRDMGGIPEYVLDAFQYAADVAYRKALVKDVCEDIGYIWWPLVWFRAWVRYLTLRKVGKFAWTKGNSRTDIVSP
jgi:hypothetical protein